MAIRAEYRPIDIISGVQPSADSTGVETRHYTYTDKIRFVYGKPQKIGGWESFVFDNFNTISGYTRSYFSDFIDGSHYGVIGTHSKLYSLIGSRLTNITPQTTTTTAVANSLDTHYDTLGSDPISAVSGSMIVTVTDANASDYVAGDVITISGATGFAGISSGALNSTHLLRSVSSGSYTINVGETATSTASGGGASVIRSSGLLTVNSAAHGMANGDRVSISGAADTGGITAAQINKEHIIRNVTTNTFDVFTDGTATSSVTSGGGASTVYAEEIPEGLINESANQGYGAGLYGVGLYGTALLDTSGRTPPRIWYFDRYANTIITTAGNQTGLYQWDGDISGAPVLISNAPTEINYAFVSDGIIVTFGAGGTENRIFASDNTDITVWTSSSTNQVYDDDIEGAGRLISHAPVDGYNLIFTEYKTYTFRYIGLPLIWEINSLDDRVGIISPMARVSINGVVFWMGRDNFYMYSGGAIEIIPANTQNECTALRYVFDDLNFSQKSKIFCWFNEKFQEIWWHYPCSQSTEPNRVIRLNIHDRVWTIDTMERTAAEYPNITLDNPYLFNIGNIYIHETGTDADGVAMPFSLISDKRYYGKITTNVNSVIPDSIQTGDITLNVSSWRYPQSTAKSYNNSYVVSPDTEIIQGINNGRIYQYTWSGNALGQNWRMGEWLEEVQSGSVSS